MSQVDKLQEAEEQVAQMREEAARHERETRAADLRRAPLGPTAAKAHSTISVALTQVRTMVNMRLGPLPDLHELAVSIKETGLLHPPLVRSTGDDDAPYELLAGRRRFSAMALLDEAEGAREWRFTLVEGISRREALTMQFAENFHQHKPEPVQFARAARAIMAEDESLTAADVSRLVGAPLTWTRKALKLLDLPDTIVQRVEEGDLAFTVADLVRRGITRGDVSEEEASALVDDHAEGRITGEALKLGVGYVPPKPKDYDEQSRKLDEARWAAARDSDRPSPRPTGRPDGADAEQRDWEAAGGEVRAARGPAAAGFGSAAPPSAADLDGYLLGLVLARVAGDEHRRALGVTGRASAHRYAFSLAPDRRLEMLRALAAQLLAQDGDPPAALRAAATAPA
jgi:ParB/RepB/Spo0J family partition protein